MTGKRKNWFAGQRRVVFLAGIFVFAASVLWAGGGRQQGGESAASTAGGRLFPVERTLTVLMPDHVLQPMKDFALAQQAIYEKTNIRLKYDIYSGTSGNERVNMLYATNQLPEMFRSDQGKIQQYASSGMFLGLSRYIDSMPNFKRYWDSMPVLKKDMINGELYNFRVVSRNETPTTMGPVIRTDLLAEHGLPIPKTWAELLDVLEALKKIYPDSIPWAVRGGTSDLLLSTAFMLGSGFSDPFYGYAGGLYFDRTADNGKGKFIYGPITQEFKTVLAFFADAYKRGVLDPDYVSANNDQWRANLMGGRSFFYNQNTTFCVDFTNTLRRTEPDATLEFIPFLSNSYGQRRAIAYANDIRTEMWGIRSDIRAPEQIAAFMDWLYSDEGSDITSYGKEGASFRYNPQGKPEFIPEWADRFRNEPQPYYSAFSEAGVSILNFCGLGANTEIIQSFNKLVGNWEGLNANYWDLLIKESGPGGAMLTPNPLPPLSDQQQERVKELNMVLDTFLNQEYDKYIMGQEPVSNWDRVIAEAVRLGAKELEDIYNAAEQPYK
jgi:ABC-type glycerol-3-phosphate transport system substrate-binding protein